jgi:peptide/nickel transport system substrate-binding protein
MRGVWRGTLVVAVLVVVLAGTLFAAPGPEPQRGGRIVISVGTDVLTFDPHNYRATTDLIVDRLIYDTLVTLDMQMRLRPGLAVRWLNLGPTAWRFELRRGVTFSDGTPVNARAVKISLERAAKAPRAAGFVGAITQVDVVDDYTVVINTGRQFAPLLNHLTSPVAGIISPAALERFREQIDRNPVGSGPFLLKEWIPDQRVVLVRNPGYWGRAPYLDEVVFRPIGEESTRYLAFRGGEVDVLSDPPPHLLAQLRRDPTVEVLLSPATRDFRIGFTVTHPVLQDVRVRRAIALAIDRASLVKFVAEGLAREAECGIIPPELMRTNPCVNVEYDPNKARAALVEAGKGDGFDLDLWTPEGRYLRDKAIAEAIQQQLAKVGIRARLRVLEWGAYLNALGRHEAQAFIIGWGFTTGDPATAMRQNFWSRSAFNYANYQNPDLDRMLDEAEAEFNPARRAQLYQRMTEILLVRDVVGKEIYHKNNIYAVRRRVHNFGAHPLELVELSETWVERR